MQIHSFLSFVILQKKYAFGFLVLLDFFAFCIIVVVPIMIQTYSAPQNDCLNLRFVKDFLIVGTKMARNGHKMDISQIQILMINLQILTHQAHQNDYLNISFVKIINSVGKKNDQKWSYSGKFINSLSFRNSLYIYLHCVRSFFLMHHNLGHSKIRIYLERSFTL